jgi:hypothetical protein
LDDRHSIAYHHIAGALLEITPSLNAMIATRKGPGLSPGLFLCLFVIIAASLTLFDGEPAKAQMRFRRDAFARLDIHNMRRVMDWCRAWTVEVPGQITEHFEREVSAEMELRARGIKI